MTTAKTKTPAAPKAKGAAKPKTIMLADLCKEVKMNPRDARMLLRLAVSKKGEYPALTEAHVPRQPWQWIEGSKALEDAKKALKTEQQGSK